MTLCSAKATVLNFSKANRGRQMKTHSLLNTRAFPNTMYFSESFFLLELQVIERLSVFCSKRDYNKVPERRTHCDVWCVLSSLSQLYSSGHVEGSQPEGAHRDGGTEADVDGCGAGLPRVRKFSGSPWDLNSSRFLKLSCWCSMWTLPQFPFHDIKTLVPQLTTVFLVSPFSPSGQYTVLELCPLLEFLFTHPFGLWCFIIFHFIQLHSCLLCFHQVYALGQSRLGSQKTRFLIFK